MKKKQGWKKTQLVIKIFLFRNISGQENPTESKPVALVVTVQMFWNQPNLWC